MADALQMLGRGAQIVVAVGAAYVLALWFVLVVWTFRDVESRSRSVLTQIFSTLLVVLFFVPGVLLYLILRPKETLDESFQRSLEEEYLLQDLEELPLCPGCHRYVEDDFLLCPNCHSTLREPCRSCARLVDLRWALCPYCGTNQNDQGEVGERVEMPAARWSAPSLRRRRVTEPAPAIRRPAPVREIGLPTAIPEPAVADQAAVAAELEEARGLAVVAGMRSIVRPFDRFRGRTVAASERPTERAVSVRPLVNVAQADGRGPSVANGNGNGHANGAAHQAHRLFDALNGKGEGTAAAAAAPLPLPPMSSTEGTEAGAAPNGALGRSPNGSVTPRSAEAGATTEEPALVRAGGESD